MARRVAPITSLKRLESLSARERQTYARTLHAHRLMRAGMSKTQATFEADTTPEAMDRYLGGAGLQKRGARWVARPGGRLWAYVQVPTTSGVRRLPVRGREADLVRAYKDALWRYVNTGDDSELVELEGRSVGGYTLLTDAAEIEELIERGELDPYEVGSGETGR
jgi:hypothetical protein